MRYVQKKTCFSTAPGILANSNENYRRYYFQAFANVSGNLGKFTTLCVTVYQYIPAGMPTSELVHSVMGVNKRLHHAVNVQLYSLLAPLCHVPCSAIIKHTHY